MKTVKFAAVTIILIMITTFSITGTVMSQDKKGSSVDAVHCRMIENEYISQIRDQLEEQGYKNAGITMTKVTGASGAREYTVQVHHRRIEKLNEEERIKLGEILLRTEFPLENCSFKCTFLNND